MTSSILNKYLEEATNSFFNDIEPKEECFFNDGNNKLKHFYDTLWLSKEIENYIAVSDVAINDIKKYVSSSDYFRLKRHECEQRIIKWLIEWIMEGRSSWVAGEEYGEDFLIMHEWCDIGFRESILKCLVNAGMPVMRAEEGIEYNSDLWFEHYMNLAFDNRYDPVYMKYNKYLIDYMPADPKHKDIWLRLRRFSYYQYHKEIMDKYGNITDDMKMSIEEVRTLYKYVEEENKKRKKFLEDVHDNLMKRLGYDNLITDKNKTKSLEEKH